MIVLSLIGDFSSEINEKSMHDFCNVYNLDSLSDIPPSFDSFLPTVPYMGHTRNAYIKSLQEVILVIFILPCH